MACDQELCQAPCSEDHSSCPLHAERARIGVFDPEKCQVCAVWITVIRETSPDLRTSLLEWARLKDQFLLAHLMTIQRNKVELRWASKETANLFPGIGLVASEASSSGSSSSADQDPSNMGMVMELLHELSSRVD